MADTDPNDKQQKVLTRYLNGEPLYKAYKAVYRCSDASAKSNAYKLLDSMEKYGIKDLGVGLDEFKSVLAGIFRNETDKQIRMRAIDLVGKTLGAFTENVNINAQVSWKEFIDGSDPKTSSE